jgi:uncharacterized protein (DUF1800 family)
MVDGIDVRRRRALAAAPASLAALAACSSPGPIATHAGTGGGAGSGAGLPPAGGTRTASAQRATNATEPAFARHLLNRFGYGPRPGEIERLCDQGAGAWLDAQLDPAPFDPPAELAAALSALPTQSGTHPATLAAFARLQADVLRTGITDADRETARRELTQLVTTVQGEARRARLLRALNGERPLEESLVEFWFNHFNVFAGKETVRVTVGYYEREAIRPYVLGRFRDLLGATARHPAMLNYLDNWQSVADGFRFPAGLQTVGGFRLPRGPNENFARELLELHTLGVEAGYTQADVSELARVFTGWSFDRRDPGATHAFRFYAARHDGRAKTVLGREVPGGGIAEGQWALDLLARHPSTARRVARRLAVAYVADAPPPSLVDRLAARYLDTDGDLREVVRALATSPEFADPAVRGGKFKTPYQYVVSAVRAVGATPADTRPLAAACARMGMPIYGCPTPDGWKDTRDAWLNADALRQRVDFAVALAHSLPPQAPAAMPASMHPDAALSMLPEPVAGALGPATRAALPSVPAGGERLAMALASPDFMRR